MDIETHKLHARRYGSSPCSCAITKPARSARCMGVALRDDLAQPSALLATGRLLGALSHLVQVSSIQAAHVSTYSERLTAALESTGKSKSEIASALGISYEAISQVLTGKTKALTAENSATAARDLGVSSYWLATGKGNMKGDGEEWLPLSLLEARALILMRSLPEPELRFAIQDIENRATTHAQRLSRILAQ